MDVAAGGCYDKLIPLEEAAMSIQIPDDTTASALAAADGPQDVHGPDGRLLGRFIPTGKPGTSFPEVGLTDEQLEQRVNDPNATWHTADQVMARLREIDACSR
jgi:hypothetical protein